MGWAKLAPYDRGMVIPKVADCGDHEWYSSTAELDACYHCRVMRESPEAKFGRIKSLRKGFDLNRLKIRDLIEDGRR